MRRVLPGAGEEVDPLTWHAGLERPVPGDRPWILANMVASADGAASFEGVSAGLGGPADREVFRALRALPDVVLAGAGTVRAERYDLPKLAEEVQDQRRARGQEPLPRLAVVSASCSLPPDLPALGHPQRLPLVITCATAPTARRQELAERAEVVDAGTDRVDLAAMARALHGRGARIVLCEGGPHLAAQLVAAGLLDELNLTISPMLAGGAAPRILAGAPTLDAATLSLAHLLEQDGMLFARYLVER